MQCTFPNRCRMALGLVAIIFLSASVLAHPGSGIAVDRIGQLFFLDTGSGLWKLDTLGRPTKLSAQRFHWLTLDENSRFANTRLSSSTGEILNIGNKPTILISSDY